MTKIIILSFILAIIFSANGKAQNDNNSDLYQNAIANDDK